MHQRSIRKKRQEIEVLEERTEALIAARQQEQEENTKFRNPVQGQAAQGHI